MKGFMITAILLIACSGCTSLTKYKGVVIEKDAQDKQVKKIETESASQTVSSTKELKLKYLDI